MKIVQAAGWYFPLTTGGTEMYVSALTARLRQLGHDVEIVTPDATIDGPQTSTYEGAIVHRFPIASPLTRPEAQGRASVRGSAWFHDWIRGARADVVHFHTLVPGLEIPEVAAAKASGARVIATTHASSLGHICARGTMMRWGRSLCDGLAEVRKCAACDLQKRGLPEWAARTAACLPVPVSDALRTLPGKLGSTLGMPSAIAFNRTRQAELIDIVDRFVLLTAWALDAAARNGAPRRKLALNRLGISGAFPRKPDAAAQPTPSPVRFGYVGRFDPIKGVHDLARAVAALPRATPFSLDVRGPLDTAEGREVHRQMQTAIGDDPRVTFGPPMAPGAVPGHLKSIDVLCCPSICLEGGPTVAIEAQATGTPVLGTRIGGLAELVTDGVDGRLVEPGDWRALASAFVQIASDPATVDRWRGRIPPARSMDDVTADYLELYEA